MPGLFVRVANRPSRREGSRSLQPVHSGASGVDAVVFPSFDAYEDDGS